MPSIIETRKFDLVVLGYIMYWKAHYNNDNIITGVIRIGEELHELLVCYITVGYIQLYYLTSQTDLTDFCCISI